MNEQKEVKRVFRLFWAWQDQKEEEWLRDMANQGWHLLEPGVLFFTFVKGVPADIVYKLDFQLLAKKDRGEYEKIFRDAGWEKAGEVANWHYFRIPASGGLNPDIFSDNESRIAKYQRLIAFLVIFFPIVSMGMMSFLHRFKGDLSTVRAVIVGLYAVLLVLWTYALFRLIFYIHKLRRKESK